MFPTAVRLQTMFEPQGVTVDPGNAEAYVSGHGNAGLGYNATTAGGVPNNWQKTDVPQNAFPWNWVLGGFAAYFILKNL